MRVNDLGESLEVVKFHAAARRVCDRWVSDKGYFWVPEHDHYVLIFAISDEILKAVKAERESCAKVAENTSESLIPGTIRERNDTESE